MENRFIILSVVVGVLFLGAVAMFLFPSGSAVKVGFIGPLTGDSATYGLPFKNVVELAVDEINSEGGVNGQMLEFVFKDGKCNRDDSAVAMNELVDEGVEVVIGGFCSDESLGAVDIAGANGVFLFSAGSSSPKLTGISPLFARSYPSDVGQGLESAEVSYHDKGWRKVAVIQQDLSYPKGLYDSFNSAFTEHGGDVFVEVFDSDDEDVKDLLMKLRDMGPDALFVVTQDSVVGERVIKQLQEIDWKPDLIVGDVFLGDADVVSRNADFLEGAVGSEFAVDYGNAKFNGLVENYRRAYGEDLPYQAYAQSEYDSVYIVAQAIREVGYDGVKLADYVRGLEGFGGASGVVSIGEDGDRAGAHKVKVIKGGKVVDY